MVAAPERHPVKKVGSLGVFDFCEDLTCGGLEDRKAEGGESGEFKIEGVKIYVGGWMRLLFGGRFC